MGVCRRPSSAALPIEIFNRSFELSCAITKLLLRVPGVLGRTVAAALETVEAVGNSSVVSVESGIDAAHHVHSCYGEGQTYYDFICAEDLEKRRLAAEAEAEEEERKEEEEKNRKSIQRSQSRKGKGKKK